MKRWNWSFLFFMMIIGMLGALSNKTIPSIIEALIFGAIGGAIIGLPIAIMSKDEK